MKFQLGNGLTVVAQEQQPAGKLTFTVGIINDVDSLNPFIGILAETYEVWALMYDYLVGYSQKDFSPVPGLAEHGLGFKRVGDAIYGNAPAYQADPVV